MRPQATAELLADDGARSTDGACDLRGLAQRGGLAPVGRRPTLRRYLGGLWRRRHFVIELARSRWVARNHEDRLGLLWNVLRPSLQAAVYGFVFNVLFASNTRPHNWTAFITSGVFVYTFTQAAAMGGARSVTGNRSLIRALHFPRATLPAATVLVELFSQLPVLIVLLAIVVVTGEPVTWYWLLVAPALVAQTMFNLGFAFVCARLTVHFNDFAQLLPFVFRLLFYFSGVFYLITRFPAAIRPIMMANPVWEYIELVREVTIGRDVMRHVGHREVLVDLHGSAAILPHVWIAAGCWAVVALVVGFVFFWQTEERYGRE